MSETVLLGTTGKLTTAELEAILVTKKRNKDQAEALLINTGLITSETAEATATNVVTAAKLKELVQTKALTQAEADLIAAKAGVTLANQKESVSLLAGVGAKIKGAGTALKGLGTGILTIASAHPVIAGITAAIALCGGAAIVNKVKQEKAAKAIKEAYENAKTAIDDINNTFNENSSKTKEIAKEYAELAQGVNLLTNENKKLSTEKYERFLDLSNQLSSLYPSLTKQYDENGNAILDLSGSVDTIVGSLDDLIERQRALANQEIVEQMPDLFKGYTNNVTDYEDKLKDAENTKEAIQSAYDEISKYGIYTAFDINGNATDENGDPVALKLGQYIDLLKKLGITAKQVNLKDSMGQIIGYKLELEDGSDIPNLSGIHDAYVSAFNQAQEDVKYAQQQLDAERSSINQYLNTWLQTEFSYNQIEDNGMQKAIQEMLFNFDWNSLPEGIDKNDWNAVSEYLRRNILFAINNVQDNPEISKAISEVFNNAELTPDEKANYLQQIQDFFGEDSAIVISLKPQIEETDTLQKQYDDAITKFGEESQDTLQKFFKDNSINDSSEIDYWNSVTKGAKSAEEAVKMYNDAKKYGNETDISTFKDAWSGTTDDVKEKLLDMVKSGEITTKVLESTEEYKTLLDKTGLSAAQVKDEITNLLNATDKLAGASKGMSNLENPYEEFKKNGFVSAETLSGLADSVFGDLDSFNLFEKIVGDPTSTKQKIQKAFDDIAKDYLLHQNTLSALTEENKQKYIANLKQMGITNAEQFVQDFQNIKNEEINVINQAERNYMAYLNSKGKANEISAEQIAKQNGGLIKSLGSAYKSDYDNWCDLLSKKANAYNDFVDALSKSGINYDDSLTARGNADKYVNQGHSANENAEMYTKAAEADRASYKAEQAKKKLKLDYKKISTSFGGGYSGAPGGSGKTGGSGGGSSSSTTIDWLQRKLEVLQNTIDLTKAKFETLFSLKVKKNNLNDQINQTKKLLKVTTKVAQRYKKYADKVKISSDSKKDAALKKKVRNGDYNISDYSSKTAEKINKYKEYYDNYKEYLKKQYELEADLLAKRQEKYEMYANKMQELNDKYDAQINNATTAKSKNVLEEKKISATKRYYDYQIKSAELEKNSTKVAQLQAEKANELNAIYKEMFDNITSKYDNLVSMIDNNEKSISNSISEIEAIGSIVGRTYYEQQIEYEKEKKKNYEAEKKKLTEQLKLIKSGTDEWYDAKNALQEVDDSISSCNTTISSLNDSIQEIAETLHSKILDDISSISSEAEFIAGLQFGEETDNDTGLLTDTGLAKLWSYGVGRDTSKAKAEQTKEQMDAYQYMLDNWDNLETNGDSKQYLQYSISSLDELKEKITDTYSEWQSEITDVYNYESNIADLMKAKYESELDAIKKIIDAKKESLQAEKDLYDCQQEIAKKTKDINTIKKQISALQGDNSQETKAKLQKLQVSLNESQKDLQDTEYDKYISDQEEMLDRLYSEYEDKINEHLNDTNALIAEGIDAINSNKNTIKNIVENTSDKYDYSISKNTNSILNGGRDYVSQITGGSTLSNIFDVVKEIADGINGGTVEDTNTNKVSSSSERHNNLLSQFLSSKNNDTSNESQEKDSASTLNVLKPIPSNGVGIDKLADSDSLLKNIEAFMKRNKKYVYTPSDAQQSKLGYANKRIYKKTGKAITSEGLSAFKKETGIKNLENYMKMIGFSKGGVARALNGVIKKNGDSLLATINPNETVLTQDFTKLMPQAVDIMEKFIKVPDYSNMIVKTPVETKVDVGDFVFNLPNVKDSDSLIKSIQTDVRVQNALKSVTVDPLSGGSRLSVRSIR